MNSAYVSRQIKKDVPFTIRVIGDKHAFAKYEVQKAIDEADSEARSMKYHQSARQRAIAILQAPQQEARERAIAPVVKPLSVWAKAKAYALSAMSSLWRSAFDPE